MKPVSLAFQPRLLFKNLKLTETPVSVSGSGTVAVSQPWQPGNTVFWTPWEAPFPGRGSRLLHGHGSSRARISIASSAAEWTVPS